MQPHLEPPMPIKTAGDWHACLPKIYDLLAANLKGRSVVDYKHRGRRLIIGRRHFVLSVQAQAKAVVVAVTEVGLSPIVAVLVDTGLAAVRKACCLISAYLSSPVLPVAGVNACLACAGALPEVNDIGNPTGSGRYELHSMLIYGLAHVNPQYHSMLMATRHGALSYDLYWATSPEAVTTFVGLYA